MSNPLKITVAEPSDIIRRGIVSILKKLSALRAEISEVDDIRQLSHTLNCQKPDILIVNGSVAGIMSIPQIRRDAANPDMKCIAIQSSFCEVGGKNYYDEVIYLSDSVENIQKKLISSAGTQEHDTRHESLSQREKEVIACVVQGMTNKQIADKLYLSAHTVITHRRNISAKLDIHSTAGLTIYAIVNKLIELDKIEK